MHAFQSADSGHENIKKHKIRFMLLNKRKSECGLSCNKSLVTLFVQTIFYNFTDCHIVIDDHNFFHFCPILQDCLSLWAGRWKETRQKPARKQGLCHFVKTKFQKAKCQIPNKK